jgi:hypothetical protein
MMKMMPPGTMAIIFLFLLFVTISAGCTSENNPGGDARAPQGESVAATSTGFIQTPVTPGTTPDGYNYPGVSSLVTPNESNLGPVNIHPPIPGMWTDPFPREETPHPLYVPISLPEGFSYSGGSYASNGIVWLRISNSTTNVIYIQTPESAYQEVCLGEDGICIQQVSAHNRNYTYTECGTQHQLYWNIDDSDFYLTGEPGSDDLLLIAGSVEPVSDETLKTILDSGPGKKFY